ncbi:HNH endonuclease [Streptomyces sp. JJ38]|uniref:HNH endonuclease signature motif containing protein n=1 Tax=Streptomyces sp. JJ38 TaxID=2738128 RepID=UPI001C59A3AB|nr:HNH endonuclease [Streptomyces sp. JJ38]MBW1598443.1 HNH endonuclease [Streptomyces sp. JJ38]
MATAYTHERLSEAAAHSRTLSAALVTLGVDPRSSTRRYVHQRMKAMGIDTSHFEREGVRWTKAVLAEAVAASRSVNDVLRRLDLDVVGGNHTYISRRIAAFGLDTSHFRARPPEHGRSKRRRLSSADVLVEITDPQARRTSPARLRCCLKERGVPERCALCGLPPRWMGSRLTLEVDHVDGNWRNNRVENLRLLFPNCHSTTDSYRGRAKGRSKRSGAMG